MLKGIDRSNKNRSFICRHPEYGVDDGPEAYRMFNNKEMVAKLSLEPVRSEEQQ